MTDFLAIGSLLEQPGGRLLALVLGIVLLAAGRRLFWLALGAVGFLVGFELAGRLLDLDAGLVQLLVGVGAGVLGIFLAIFLQRLAIAVLGFVVGGTSALSVFDTTPEVFAAADALVFLVGGIVVALVAAFLFEIALVGLSALAGAALVAGAAGLDDLAFTVATFLLALVGIAIQAGLGPGSGRKRRRR